MPTLLDPVNIDEVEAMIKVNLLGVIYAFSAVLPEMLRRRSGHLAAVSSLAGYTTHGGRVGLLCEQGGGERVPGRAASTRSQSRYLGHDASARAL